MAFQRYNGWGFPQLGSLPRKSETVSPNKMLPLSQRAPVDPMRITVPQFTGSTLKLLGGPFWRTTLQYCRVSIAPLHPSTLPPSLRECRVQTPVQVWRDIERKSIVGCGQGFPPLKRDRPSRLSAHSLMQTGTVHGACRCENKAS